MLIAGALLFVATISALFWVMDNLEPNWLGGMLFGVLMLSFGASGIMMLSYFDHRLSPLAEVEVSLSIE